jgi:RNA polymerase sigma-32 factor
MATPPRPRARGLKNMPTLSTACKPVSSTLATSGRGLRSVEAWEKPRPVATRPRSIAPERYGSRSSTMAYMQEVRRHPLLTREEEHSIALEFAKSGDLKLSSRLVKANLRLVIKIALEYRTHHNLLDLVQEGNVGLLHAVQKYDPNRGVKLSTYAAWWIRAYILKFILSNARLVKLGTTQAQRRLFFGLRREKARLAGLDGEIAGTRQLAAALSVSETEVVEMERRLSSYDTSLDWPSRGENGDERPRGDTVSAEPAHRPDVQSETYEFHDALTYELRVFRQTLTGREAEIFDRRLVCEDATTLADVATRFGVSRERVRQLEERLKKRLRQYLRASLGDAVPAGDPPKRKRIPAKRSERDSGLALISQARVPLRQQ